MTTEHRRVIAYEGVPTADGRQITPFALTWVNDPEPIPLLLAPQDTKHTGHAGSRIIGTVTNITRRPHRDGERYANGPFKICATLTTDHPLVDEHGARLLHPEIDIDDVTWEYDGAEIMHTTAARLRAVTLGTRPAWPGLILETVPR